jgi:uncharacterized Zn finger protein
MYWRSFKPYVSVARRRAQAAREVAKLQKNGDEAAPIVIEGRCISTTFWGKAWCENLESYSDFSNRLPRGRSYVRNGSVVDLKIQPGEVVARVSGSSLYRIKIAIKPLPAATWKAVKSQCAGQIGSLVELLQGKFSKHVMDIVTARDGGLFPKPAEISMSCSCPDYAGLCKHLAAVMYGIGARLDRQPELLFKLRQVEHLELIEEAGHGPALGKGAAKGKKTIADNDLADVFGIEFDAPASVEPPQVNAATTVKRAPRKSKPAATTATAEPVELKPATAKPSKKRPTTGVAKNKPAATPSPAKRSAARSAQTGKKPSPAKKAPAARKRRTASNQSLQIKLAAPAE